MFLTKQEECMAKKGRRPAIEIKQDPFVYFVGAGPGAPDLITVRGMNLLQRADFVLYTGSLIPAELLDHIPWTADVRSSQDMSYDDIYSYMKENAGRGVFIRLHTGDPSIYSTMARQIEFLREEKIAFEVVPGVTAAFAGAASLGLEYTVPGVSQTLVVTRMEGRTGNPEPMKNLLRLKHSSHVFYLSVTLLEELCQEALASGWNPETPVKVVERASWPEEQLLSGNLGNIAGKVKRSRIKGAALILLGAFLEQKGVEESHLYSEGYAKKGRYEPAAPENRKTASRKKATAAKKKVPATTGSRKK